MTRYIEMNREQRRAAQKHMAKESATFPAHLVELDLQDKAMKPPGLIKAFRSREYLVQVFSEGAPVLARLSVNRTRLAGNDWGEDIPWIDMQRIKNECGFTDFDAVEVFPAQKDVVNVANLRHLWIMGKPLGFAWRANK